MRFLKIQSFWFARSCGGRAHLEACDFARPRAGARIRAPPFARSPPGRLFFARTYREIYSKVKPVAGLCVKTYNVLHFFFDCASLFHCPLCCVYVPFGLCVMSAHCRIYCLCTGLLIFAGVNPRFAAGPQVYISLYIYIYRGPPLHIRAWLLRTPH